VDNHTRAYNRLCSIYIGILEKLYFLGIIDACITSNFQVDSVTDLVVEDQLLSNLQDESHVDDEEINEVQGESK
jgi:hypothetical protein